MKRSTSINPLNSIGPQKWYLIANRVEADLYVEGTDRQFHLIHRLENPKGKLTEGQLDSDKAGRCVSKASSIIHHALDRHFKKHEQIAVEFVNRIGKYLSQASQKDRFDEITLVAEPHFLGLLREHLPHQILHKKVRTVDREYIQIPVSEIRRNVLEILSESNR